MSRRPNAGDQSIAVGGSCTQLDTLDISEEPLELGRAITGQTGASASVSAVLSGKATITGLTGMSSLSVGRILVLSGASTGANNGAFRITDFFSSSTVNISNTAAIAPDANNGAISWVEREPYTLEDDINYRRTNERLIKGTTVWSDPIPTYVRPTDTLTDVPANLTNIATKTTDAKSIFEPRSQESVSVSSGSSFITISDIGNLKHADSVDITGIAVTDGYDSGNDRGAFVVIVDANIDGYGDGAELVVLNGAFAGDNIFGKTRAGSSTSPDSVEIEFFSRPQNDWSIGAETPYTWEADQTTLINVGFGYRQRLDLLDENAIREAYIRGSLRDTAATGGGSGGGITEGAHTALRALIHFIDCGPADGFASGAFHEILPSGNPFPTSYIWWESVSQIDKIVELTVTRDSTQKPITEVWKMYDTDGSTILTTVTDSISYMGPFETSRVRAIA